VPAPGKPRLERHLVELRIAEGGESGGPPLHVGGEPLLDYNNVRKMVIPCFLVEVQSDLRSAPHLVEWVVSEEKVCDRRLQRHAGVEGITGFNRSAKACLDKVNRSCSRLRPDGSRS